MASRDKKVIVGKKQATASPAPNEEEEDDSQANTAPLLEKVTDIPVKVELNKQPIKRRILRKKDPKKVIKKTFKVTLKAKGKLNPKLGKTIVAKSRGKVKKTLLKNGVTKTRVIRRKPTQTRQIDDPDDKPPVLEPFDSVECITDKRLIKKKVATKKETDSNNCTIAATIESIINKTNSQKAKAKLKSIKKLQSTTESIVESIEDVVKQSDEVQIEIDTDKIKKLNAKKLPKIELLKKKIKKENMEIDTSESNVIDMLDLNVREIKSKMVETRRHSIEKFPISNQDVKVQDSSIFNNLPRSISPKNKRPINKVRQSLDSRRSSPYTTRSDSPARILRNGKQRKLKHLNLLDGLDSDYKKRRRLCSDYSGSEVSVSKLSGYESDSSFSDLASVQGPENSENADVLLKDLAIKKELLETLENNPPETIDIRNIPEKFAATIKRSLSLESGVKKDLETKIIDTNSNLCSDSRNKIISNSQVRSEDSSDALTAKSFKDPDKETLLDIMKQTFNEVIDTDQLDSEKRKTRSTAKKGQKSSDDSNSSDSKVELGANNNNCDSNEKDLQEVMVVEKMITTENTLADLVDTKEMVEVEDIEINGAVNSEIVEADLPEEESLKDKENIHDNINVQLNGEVNSEMDISKPNIIEITETPEDMAIKNEILKALGLQSLQAAEEAKLRKLVPRSDSYTGTLKTVIKLNRYEKKKGRNSLKLTLQKKGKSSQGKEDDVIGIEEDEYKIMKEGNSTWKSQQGNQSSDTAGAQRKSHYSNRSNMDGSSEHTSDGDTNANEDGSGKLLVIPEKASSFSIHPGRLCKDECSYCFGKFGLFDTPCHIAQMKSVDRQNKILSAEKHLTRDSCLCDACYRHVDRKSNTPSYTSNKSLKRNTLVAPGPRQNHCHVLGCGRIASNILKRKWLIKMRKSVCQVINIDLDNPGLHSIPICEEHYASLEHLMVCAMCKRRLARNHIHYLGQESNDLNAALNEMGIPVKLNDRPVVCKLCRYFATLVLKNPEDRNENSANFFVEYRKRLLHFHDIEIMDESQAEEPIPAPMKDKVDKDQMKKRKKLSKSQNNLEPPVLEPQVDICNNDEPKSRVPSTDSRAESPSDYMVDYNNLMSNVASEYSNDIEMTRREISKKTSVSIKRVTKPNSIKDALEKSKKLKNKSDIAVQRLGSNPSISVRQLFPGEEDLSLNGNIEFHNVKERTPEGWEKCISTIQFDPEVKMLWNELQKPYGNQSSFLRHLILLEKYFRNGDLVLAPSASNHSVNYTESVQNRLKAYDNIPSNVGTVQPLTMIPFNNKPPNKSISGIITSTKETAPPTQTTTQIATATIEPSKSIPSIVIAPVLLPTVAKNIPVTVSQINNTSFLVPNPAAIMSAATVAAASVAAATSTVPPITPSLPAPLPTPIAVAAPVRPKLPPGLISLQPGTKLPITPLVKLPQSQKIKFPITKNWRPNLIPIDPSKKPEKKPGLVQVISGGKPYHISLEDYKKMCAIKRTFDLRQKRLQEQQRNPSASGSVLKNIPARKGLVISKTSSAVSPTKVDSNSDQEFENSLEKLDKTVEKLEANLNDKSLIMPKIPKSLTVIPQTVTKKTSRPPSPSLLIAPKNKPTGKS